MEHPDRKPGQFTESPAVKSEPWEQRWTLDASVPSKGGNQSQTRGVREISGGRRAALKTLREPEKSERRARMIREIEILKKLNGRPGIPAVLDHSISSAEQGPFIILEWIEGKPLSERFTGPGSINESAQIALQLCTIVNPLP